MNTIKLAIIAGFLFPVAAVADDALEVSVGHAALMRLTASPAQIVVGDPTIADITVQSAKSLAVFGKRAGGTSLAGLDSKGAVLWERTVVVVQADAGGGLDPLRLGQKLDPGRQLGDSGVFFRPLLRPDATACRHSPKITGEINDGTIKPSSPPKAGDDGFLYVIERRAAC